MSADIRNARESTLWPGDYLCRCVSCDRWYFGPKRSMVCDECRVARVECQLAGLTPKDDEARFLPLDDLHEFK